MAVRRFCVNWAGSGPNSQATLQVFVEQMAWCSQDPVIPSPFPLHILQTMHGVKLNLVWPATRFWLQVEKDVGVAYGAAPADAIAAVLDVLSSCGDQETTMEDAIEAVRQATEGYAHDKENPDVCKY